MSFWLGLFLSGMLLAEPRPLPQIYPVTTGESSAAVDVRLEGAELVMDFDVMATGVFGRPDLDLVTQFPFQFDVVEIFVTASTSRFPYYEIELSPFGQTFQVRVPWRGAHPENNVELGATGQTERVEGGWHGHLRLPLAIFGRGVDPRKIVGNAYAILGKDRHYFSLFLKSTGRPPNFHQPQSFQPLL